MWHLPVRLEHIVEIKHAIARVVEREDLAPEQMAAVMGAIMTGGATPAQIAAFLVALRMKGETPIEIAAAADTLRALATVVDLSDLEYTVDIVGTGGDGSGTFNISTASMFVAAAAGCQVAKHGNRSVSSRSGSADVLEAAGVCLELTPTQVEQCVREVGVGFLFAPVHHRAMKHAIGPRREIGVRTLFNILGPLTNPARVPRQVLGVFAESLLLPLAEALRRLGTRHALVVHGREGLDEIGLGARTDVAELRDGHVTRYDIGPEDFGLTPAALAALQVDGPAASLALLRAVLGGLPGPASDVVALNAGAAIYVSGRAPTLAAGVACAREVLRTGAALERFAALIALTQRLNAAEAASVRPPLV